MSWDTDSGKGNRTQHEKYNSFQHGKVCISPEIWTFFLALLLLEGTDPISYDIKEIRCKKAYRERGKSGMVRFKYDNEPHNRLFLCFLIICMLVAGTAYETLDSEKLSYAGMNALNTISSPGNETFDIVVREHSGFSVIKNAASRNSSAGRPGGFKTAQAWVVINGPAVLSGTGVLFLLYLCRNLAACHHFIIIYIHNLDGMKP